MVELRYPTRPKEAALVPVLEGNGTTEGTYYIGNLLEMVRSGSVTNYRHYMYVGGEPIAAYSRESNGTNTFSYFPSDHQSSMAAITNSSGGVVVNERRKKAARRETKRMRREDEK
jgi:hypothetical protein